MKIQINSELAVERDQILNRIYGAREVIAEDGTIQRVEVVKRVDLLNGQIHQLAEPYDEAARRALGYPPDPPFGEAR